MTECSRAHETGDRSATDPLSSMSFPNSAPRINIGKNCAINLRGAAHEGLRPVGEQGFTRGGAAPATRQPARGEARSSRGKRADISQGEGNEDSNKAHGIKSAPSRTSRSIEERLPSILLALASRKASAERRRFIAQHGIENPTRRLIWKRLRSVARTGLCDKMDAHVSPLRSFTASRIRDFPQQRDHSQLLQVVRS